MATMSMPKKEKELGGAEPMTTSQKRPQLERYWVQVDRQTKSSFKSRADAEKAGASIKKAFPKVQLSIYDAEESSTAIL